MEHSELLISHYQRLIWTTVTLIVLVGCTYSLPKNTLLDINKLTVPVGGDATLSCAATKHVNEWVRWDRVDTGDILAMEKHVIVSDPRISISLWDNHTWTLSIIDIQKEDEGIYRCAAHARPSSMQDTYLEVVEVPKAPSIVMSSMNTSVQEGSTLILVCRVDGHPKPVVTWTRVDQKAINLISNAISMEKRKEMSYVGEVLKLTEISKEDAGPYRCLANNSISPEATEIMHIEVTYKPKIKVYRPLIVVPLGSEVRLNCTVVTSSMTTTHWSRTPDASGMIMVGEEYAVREQHYQNAINMTLIIREFQRQQSGVYFCVARNTHGSNAGKVEVYNFQPETEALQTTGSGSNSIYRVTDPEKNLIAVDINPKRGHKNLAESANKNKHQQKKNMRSSYFNLLSFLRFYGLLMSYY
ncbi:hypothetical protein SK128_016380 [Halocaridina rubra]|uniref:Ig-like domain-containing protein n=1 Tax=Halocaridina rubra TaxID=373956 RepID=A0AAN8XUB3_HALRR